MLTAASILPSGGADQQNVGEAKDSILPAEVRAQYEKQANAMKVLHLDFNETLSGPDVPNYYGGPTTYSVYLDGCNFLLRTLYLYRNNGGKSKMHEDAFDGRVFYYGDPNTNGHASPILKKCWPSDLSDPQRTIPIYFRYFKAAGFYAPERIADLAPYRGLEPLAIKYIEESSSAKVETAGQKLRLTVEIPDRLLIDARAVNLEERRQFLKKAYLNGAQLAEKEIPALKTMQSMEPKRTVTLVLDAKYGYGVIEREEFTATGKRIVLVQSSEWKYYEPVGIWLPGRCVESYYTERFALTDFSDQPRSSVTFQLDEVQFSLPKDIKFALDYTTAGSMILDRTSLEARERPGHQVAYKVAADGTKLLQIAQSVTPLQNKKTRMWRFLILIFLAIPPATVCTRYLLRKARRNG
jgi:hypothetical protein